MAWAELHLMAGSGIYGIAKLAGADSPELIPAVILSCMTHPVLDDMNVDAVSVYHGFGKTKAVKIITSIFRAVFWGAFLGLAIWEPWVLVCAVPAWLICDWEWFVKWNVGIGIHNRSYKRPWAYMYPDWLKTQRGLIPIVIVLLLFFWMVIGGRYG